jgi:hypothetical protein
MNITDENGQPVKFWGGIDKVGVTTMRIEPAMIRWAVPSSYRLMKRKDGALVLQGAYRWEKGCEAGFDWEDIETVEALE